MTANQFYTQEEIEGRQSISTLVFHGFRPLVFGDFSKAEDQFGNAHVAMLKQRVSHRLAGDSVIPDDSLRQCVDLIWDDRMIRKSEAHRRAENIAR